MIDKILDDSSYQDPPEEPTPIDYTRVKAAGVQMIMTKVSEGTWTGYPLDLAVSQIKKARAADIPVCPYHFHRFEAGITTQSHYFLDCALSTGYTPAGSPPPMVDVQSDEVKVRQLNTLDDYKNALPAALSYLGQIRDFLAAVSNDFGVIPLWYSGDWYLRWMIQCWLWAGKDLTWMDYYPQDAADYRVSAFTPPPHWRPVLRQYTDYGQIDGIAGRVDLNRWLGTDAEFNAFIKGQPVKPEPTPQPIGTWIVATGAETPRVGPGAGYNTVIGYNWPIEGQVLFGYEISGQWLRIEPLKQVWIWSGGLKKE